MLHIISLSIEWKKQGHSKFMMDKHVVLILEKPSLRTRISFEVGINQLGGMTYLLNEKEMQLGERETVEDTAKVLSRFSDGILVRSFEHSTILGFAEYADVPVINGLTNYNHPTQAIADVMTILEGFDNDLDHLNICFIGDRTNVCNSLFNNDFLQEKQGARVGNHPLEFRVVFHGENNGKRAAKDRMEGILVTTDNEGDRIVKHARVEGHGRSG